MAAHLTLADYRKQLGTTALAAKKNHKLSDRDFRQMHNIIKSPVSMIVILTLWE